MFNKTEKAAFVTTAVYFAALLTACSAIDARTPPPKDWPKLEVKVEKVGFWELQSKCGTSGLIFALKQSFACARIYFDRMACEIFYAADDEYGALAVEHELDHCKGYDHIGMSTLRDGWEKWKNERS